MNRKAEQVKYQVLIVAALTGLSTPVYAQDVSGFRIEGRIGWEQVRGRAEYPNPEAENDDDAEEFLAASDRDRGVFYGGEAGYDFQINRSLVLGAYGGADFSDSEMCAELFGDDQGCARLRRNFTLGARAGVPLGEWSLAYVKGGYSNGKFKGSYDDDVTDNDDDEPGPLEAFSESRGGYHLGGGVQLGFTRNVYAKLEYVYTNYGTRSYPLGDDEGADPGLKLKSQRHQVLAGIGLRF